MNLMKLIVTEKPSIARDIANVVRATAKKDGFFLGETHLVTWAFGHLIQWVDPDAYDEKYKSWTMADLPIIPQDFRTAVIESPTAKKQFSVIVSLMTHDKVEEIICATDAGREGELIFRLIYLQSGSDKPVKRLWISSQTDTAIKEGLENLKPATAYNGLYDSARCRAQADWLIGMNASRAYTLRYSYGQGVLSVGRVQTPVLKMIVDRYDAHTRFQPEPFYELHAQTGHPNGTYAAKWFRDKETRFFNKNEAVALLEEIKRHKEGRITKVTKKEKKEKQPLLYDLTELQRDANKKFKYSADQTLKLMQDLYEKHKILTYPRTSSRYLSADIVPKLPGLIKNLEHIPEYQPFIDAVLAGARKPGKRIADDKKVTDHHAIIPTDKKPDLSKLNRDELAVYDLVIRRFLSVFLPECVKDHTEIITLFGDATFKTTGTVIRRSGWRAPYMDKEMNEESEDDEDAVLPQVAENDRVTLNELNLTEGQTKAPPLYNEASILAAMETAGKTIEDEELRDAMKDCGLGTPATRAQILERLIAVNYIVREKNRLIPTEKGIHLIRSIRDPSLTSPELTGEFEKKLNDMAQNRYDREAYMKDITEFTRRIVAQVVTSVSEKLGVCPVCGGDVMESKMTYGCANWKTTGCKFAIWKTIAGRPITPEDAKVLLEKQQTDVLEGFTNKQNRPFAASLVLENGKVGFRFSAPSFGKCPACKEGNITESPKSYSCSKWKENGCKFTIWKTVAGYTLTVEDVTMLLSQTETGVIDAFKTQSGRSFSGKLRLENNRLTIQPVNGTLQ